MTAIYFNGTGRGIDVSNGAHFAIHARGPEGRGRTFDIDCGLAEIEGLKLTDLKNIVELCTSVIVKYAGTGCE